MKRLPEYIEIETSRYCNRLCGWCPNSYLNDRRTQQLLDFEVFLRILYELRQANYSGWIAFHNYNEPLANPRLSEEIATASEVVPKAKLAIYSNGYLLNQSVYRTLEEFNVRELRITIYPRHSQTKSHELAQLNQWLLKRPFFLSRQWSVDKKNRRGAVLVSKCRTPNVMLIAPKVQNYYDRGGVVSHLSGAVRTMPCHLTSHSLSIDYLGRIKMCCNVVPDANGHSQYVLGNAKKQSILEVWSGSEFERLRACHRRGDWRQSEICRTCIQNI